MSPVPHMTLNTLIQSLRQSVGEALPAASPTGGYVDALFRKINDELSRVLSEHAGMADELLRAYEQLGIVFEVTRRIATVHNEEEVIRLFIDSLRVTCSDKNIYVYDRGEECSLRPAALGPCGPPEVVDAVQESIEAGTAIVRSLNSPAGGPTEVLAAPVQSGADFVCAIVMTHGALARQFESGDMSLLESLALYCGDVIRNFRLAMELRSLSVDMVRALVSAVDQKDAYTFGHSNRVGYYAKMLGAELGLNEEELQMLEWSALLHDVGKIGIRDDVLKKPGKLTEDEFRHIQEHPVRSWEVVRQVPQLKGALAGVRHHHERYDGTGYPDGLAGEDIPLQARIIQAADIFDALTTSRSYRGAFDWEKALSILREDAGKVCHPDIVEVIDRLIRREVAAGRLNFDMQANLAAPGSEPSSAGSANGAE